MRSVLTLILAGGKGQRLDPLTRDRAKPAVPFGGIYRIIDFTLSNCINSGLRQILVLTQYKSISLERHLRDAWGFLSPSLGEYVIPLPPQQRISDNWYLGTADSVHQNLYTIKKEMAECVLILSGDHVYKMNYRLMVNFHRRQRANLTAGCVETDVAGGSQFGIMQIDETYRIIGFEEKPEHPKPIPGDASRCLASMGIYVFNSDVLIDVLEEDARDPKSSHDFGRNILPRMIKEQSVFAYRFIDENKKEAKYWRDVGTLDSYWNADMDLVSVSPIFNLYDDKWPIRTNQVQAPPPKFVHAEDFPGGRRGVALNSLVSHGCIVSGGMVFNSILSPFVRINSFSDVRDSILFDNVIVGRGARIRRAIIDKGVKVPDGFDIGYDPDQDRQRFVMTPQGVVVIPKGEVL